MPDSPDVTTLHRISVPADAEALVFPDPYRSNVELTESMSTVDVRIPAHSAVTYSFQSGELKYPDPHNAHGAGPQASLLSGDSVDQTLWPPRSPEVIADLPGARLSIDRKVFGRRCTARLDDRGADTTVVFLDGDDWIHLHDLTGALDRTVTAGLIPQINRVFLPAAKDRSEEYTSQTFASALATELPPIINSSHIVLVGQSFGGLSALRAALTASTETTPAIKGAIAQSPAVWWSADRSAELADTLSDGPAGGDIAAQLTGPSLENPAAHSGSGLARIVLTCGAEEPPMQRHVDAVADALTRRGFPTTNHRTPGGHDPAMWRHGIIPALAELLG